MAMALSQEQRTEIIGMIQHAQQEVHARAMGEVATGLEEIRNATGLFYDKQNTLNAEYEVKFGKLSKEVEDFFWQIDGNHRRQVQSFAD